MIETLLGLVAMLSAITYAYLRHEVFNALDWIVVLVMLTISVDFLNSY